MHSGWSTGYAFGAAILQEGCLRCHGPLVDELVSARGGDAVRCVHCHRGVGHGPTR